jgi:hypothetical protein
MKVKAEYIPAAVAERIAAVFLANDWRWWSFKLRRLRRHPPSATAIAKAIAKLENQLDYSADHSEAESGRLRVVWHKEGSYPELSVYVHMGSLLSGPELQ